MALTRLGLNQSINLASNVTGTLATGNGGTGATSFSPGKVLQVQHSSVASVLTSTTTTFASVISVDITPSNSSNKIYLTGQLGEIDYCDGRLAIRFYKGGSWIGSSNVARVNAEVGRGLSNTGEETHRGNMTGFYMDTAGGTSAITYALYFARTQGSGTVRCGNGSPNLITAMEIAV